MKWLLKQLNMAPREAGEFAEHIDEVRWGGFKALPQNPVEQGFVVAGVLVLLVLAALFIYFRQRRNLPTVPPGLRITLSATRVLILLLLVLVLGDPFIRLDH